MRRIISTLVVASFCITGSVASAQFGAVTDGAKKAGSATKEVGKATVETTKDAAKATEKGTKKVAEGTKNAVEFRFGQVGEERPEQVDLASVELPCIRDDEVHARIAQMRKHGTGE